MLNKQSITSVSREIGVNESLIFKWRRKALGKGDGIKTGVELSKEKELKKQIRELEEENEILKKVAIIFGKGG